MDNRLKRIHYLTVAAMLAGFLSSCTSNRPIPTSLPTEMLSNGRSNDMAETRLRFEMSTPRGASPTYNIGETMKLKVTTFGDVYLNCFYRLANGDIIRIFPNRFDKSGYIEANQVTNIPSTDDFSIRFDHAETAEQFLCFSSLVDPNPFVAPELRNMDLYRIDTNVLSRFYQFSVRELRDIFDIYTQSNHLPLRGKAITVTVTSNTRKTIQ